MNWILNSYHQFRRIGNIFNINFKRLERYIIFVFVFLIMRIGEGKGLKLVLYSKH